jgi:hypothetical protein
MGLLDADQAAMAVTRGIPPFEFPLRRAAILRGHGAFSSRPCDNVITPVQHSRSASSVALITRRSSDARIGRAVFGESPALIVR